MDVDIRNLVPISFVLLLVTHFYKVLVVDGFWDLVNGKLTKIQSKIKSHSLVWLSSWPGWMSSMRSQSNYKLFLMTRLIMGKKNSSCLTENIDNKLQNSSHKMYFRGSNTCLCCVREEIWSRVATTKNLDDLHVLHWWCSCFATLGNILHNVMVACKASINYHFCWANIGGPRKRKIFHRSCLQEPLKTFNSLVLKNKIQITTPQNLRVYFTESDSSLNSFLVFEITFFTERYLTYFYLQNTFYSSPKSSYADMHLGTFLFSLFSFLLRICNLFCNSELRLNCAQNKTRKRRHSQLTESQLWSKLFQL